MLYHLFEYLINKGIDFPGAGLMKYLSVRAMLASVTAILISFIAGGRIIRWLQIKKYGEIIRDLDLEGQQSKKGTPTMGGIIIILSIIVPVLLFCNLTSIYTQLLILTTLWCGGIGFMDDSIKVFRKNKKGLSARGKLILQLGLGLIIGLAVCYSNQIVVRETPSEDSKIVAKGEKLDIDSERLVESTKYIGEDVVKSTKTTIPFVKDHEFDYKVLSPFKGAMGWYTKWAIYVLMIVIVIMACSNGANITDGLDGLAAGTSAIVGVVIGILAWVGGNVLNASYLNVMYIPGSGEVAIFMSAFVGALLGFLWYNASPAEVFMGDTGSLTIGGIIGVSAILIRKELLLPILCGIFVVESASTIIQRLYFRHTRIKYGEGKRIFRTAPLHHHFQNTTIPALIQYPKHTVKEQKIVTRFWLIGIILAVATLALLKIR